jgi:hypothetical protein
MAKSDLTAARLRELLHYDAITGEFTWRVYRCGRAIQGQQAARQLRPHGYLTIFVDGKVFRAHRLAWLYVTGSWPSGVVDHMDGKTDNNAFSNLRDVSHSVNLQNRRQARVDSLLGLMGVTHHPKNNKYQARITLDKKTKSLGYFCTAEEAHQAYLEAKRQLHVGCTI